MTGDECPVCVSVLKNVSAVQPATSHPGFSRPSIAMRPFWFPGISSVVLYRIRSDPRGKLPTPVAAPPGGGTTPAAYSSFGRRLRPPKDGKIHPSRKRARPTSEEEADEKIWLPCCDMLYLLGQHREIHQMASSSSWVDLDATSPSTEDVLRREWPGTPVRGPPATRPAFPLAGERRTFRHRAKAPRTSRRTPKNETPARGPATRYDFCTQFCMPEHPLLGYGLAPKETGRTLECDICVEMAWEPVITQCGHLFCRACIEKWLATSPVCPVCTKHASTSVLIPLYGRGRSRTSIRMGSESIRQAKRSLVGATSMEELRERAEALLESTSTSVAAERELRQELANCARAKIDALQVSMCTYSEDIEQKLIEVRNALEGWKHAPVGLLQITNRLLEDSMILRMRHELGEVTGLFKSSGDFHLFEQSMQRLIGTYTDKMREDGLSWCFLFPMDVTISLLKKVWEVPPSTPHPAHAFQGVLEATLDCDPAPLRFPGISSLILDGTWCSESFDSTLRQNFPNVKELTVQDAELLLSSSLTGVHVVNYSFDDVDAFTTLYEELKRRGIAFRFRRAEALSVGGFPASEGRNSFWCREYKTAVSLTGVRLTEPTGSAKKVADLAQFKEMLTAHRAFWWLPFDSPRAAFEIFEFVAVLKKEVLLSCAPLTASFIQSRGGTTEQGFEGAPPAKKDAARQAFNALTALHCKNLAAGEVVVGVVDVTATLDDWSAEKLQSTSVEAAFCELEPRFFPNQPFTRRWVLPEARMIHVDVTCYKGDHSTFQNDVVWLRKQERLNTPSSRR